MNFSLPESSSGEQPAPQRDEPHLAESVATVRVRAEIMAALTTYRETLADLVRRMYEQELGRAAHFSSSGMEDAWSDRDTLNAAIATLAWVLMESTVPPYPLADPGGEQKG